MKALDRFAQAVGVLSPPREMLALVLTGRLERAEVLLAAHREEFMGTFQDRAEARECLSDFEAEVLAEASLSPLANLTGEMPPSGSEPAA